MFMTTCPPEEPTEEHSNIPVPKIDLVPRYLEDLCDYVQEMELPTALLETERIDKNFDSDKRPPHIEWEDTIEEDPGVPARRGRPRKKNTTVRKTDLTSSFHLL